MELQNSAYMQCKQLFEQPKKQDGRRIIQNSRYSIIPQNYIQLMKSFFYFGSIPYLRPICGGYNNAFGYGALLVILLLVRVIEKIKLIVKISFALQGQEGIPPDKSPAQGLEIGKVPLQLIFNNPRSSILPGTAPDPIL